MGEGGRKNMGVRIRCLPKENRWKSVAAAEIMGRSLGSPRDLDGEGSQDSIWVTLAETHNSGNMEPVNVTSCSQADFPIKQYDSNSLTKLSTEKFSCLKETQKQEWNRG